MWQGTFSLSIQVCKFLHRKPQLTLDAPRDHLRCLRLLDLHLLQQEQAVVQPVQAHHATDLCLPNVSSLSIPSSVLAVGIRQSLHWNIICGS